MKNRKAILIFVIMLLLLSGCGQDVSMEERLFDTVMEGLEISDIVEYKGAVYAGGIEGIYRIDKETLQYEKLDLGGILFVKDLLISNGILYAGHDEGIISYDGKSYHTVFDRDMAGEDVRVNNLMVDEDKRLWAGTYSGVYFREDHKWENIDSESGLMDDTVFLIMDDGFGGMIFGHYASSNSGISYFKNGSWQYYTVDQGLPHNYITCGIKMDGTIYIGTGFYDKGGLAVFDTGPDKISLISTILRDWGENGSKVRSLNLDGDIIWVGTEYNGLCIYETEEDSFTRFGSEDGLVGQEVKSILFSGDKVFLGMRNGVSVGNIDDLYRYCGIKK